MPGRLEAPVSGSPEAPGRAGHGFGTLPVFLAALSTILGAPRRLRALGKDGACLFGFTNRLLARGGGEANQPRIATLVTAAIALVCVSLGDVDFVALLISMFFMVTYDALCSVSLLEQFAASPSSRPSFRSRCYLSRLGAGLCLLMLFQMDPVLAVLAPLAMLVAYWLTRFTPAGPGGASSAGRRPLPSLVIRAARSGISAATG